MAKDFPNEVINLLRVSETTPEDDTVIKGPGGSPATSDYPPCNPDFCNTLYPGESLVGLSLSDFPSKLV